MRSFSTPLPLASGLAPLPMTAAAPLGDPVSAAAVPAPAAGKPLAMVPAATPAALRPAPFPPVAAGAALRPSPTLCWADSRLTERRRSSDRASGGSGAGRQGLGVRPANVPANVRAAEADAAGRAVRDAALGDAQGQRGASRAELATGVYWLRETHARFVAMILERHQVDRRHHQAHRGRCHFLQRHPEDGSDALVPV